MSTISILAPMTGEIIPLSQVADPVFSSEKLGQGFGIKPTKTNIIAPVTGTVTMVADTKHALGFSTDSGLEFLLHLGIDTVELEGKPFTLNVVKGDRVEAGRPLASMNLDAVRAAGKDTTAILVITNSAKKLANLDVQSGSIQAGETVAEASLKGSSDTIVAPWTTRMATVPAAGQSAPKHESTEPQTSTPAVAPAPETSSRPANLKGYDALAWDIINNIGGAENIKSVIHCITRVRFYLKDDSKANDQVVKNLDGVIDLARAGGQYQVVIGPAVTDVYEAVVKQLGADKAGGKEAAVEPAERPTTAGGWFKWGFSSLIGVITGSMMPVIGLLAASGVLKGILTILTHYELIDAKSQTFTIINAIGDAVFYFLPIFVGFTAAKRLGADPIIVAIIGGILAYPAISAMSKEAATGSILGISTNAEFFGIPFPMVSYTYSIFPMIVAAWLCSKIEPWLKRVIPAVLRMIFVPLIEVFVVSALILVVLGPIIMFISNGLAQGIQSVYNLSPALSGLVIGAFYQCLVIFGLHWAVIPIVANDIASTGHSYLNAIISATMVAQGAGALAVFAKTRNKQMKGLSGSAAIAGFCGITEPAMYGINLKYGRVFALSSVGAAVGGFLTGFLHVNMWGFTGSLIGFFSFVNPNGGFDHSWDGFWIASGATVVVAFVLVFFFGFKDSDLENERTVEKKRLVKRDAA